jgi:MFS family permease
MLNNIRVLTWFNFFTDFRLYEPIAILYFAQVTGSFALGMSIFSIAMVSSALFEIPTGIFSDYIGRKKTIMIGATFATLSVTLYAVGGNFWFLAVGALFEGLSRSFYSGNNDALLYDTLAENNQIDKYAEFLGKTNKMFQIALGISAVMGGLILFNGNFSVLIWLSVIPQSICLILSFFYIEPKNHSNKSGNIYKHLKEAIMQFIHNRKLRYLSLASIIGHGFGEATYQFQSAFYATVWPAWAIPIAKLLSNSGATISFHFSGKIIEKFNVIKVILLGNIYSRFIMIIAAALPSVFSPILMSSTSLVYGLSTVAKNSLMQKEFKHEQRATMSSLNSFAGNMLFGVVAIFLGAVADKLNPASAFIILQIFNASNILIYMKLNKKEFRN